MHEGLPTEADPPETDPPPRFLVPALMVGLTVWGIYLAVGAARSGHNWHRALPVIISFTLFLGWFWWLQRLYARRHPPK